MKRVTLFAALALLINYNAASAQPSMLSDKSQNLVIQNRILTKVNNKTISVLDVVKKMDIFFTKQYPQYADNPAAKFQFYSSQWKDMLLQMVDQELIIADAEKLELKITDSEVRESLHDKFGPNVMDTLDSLGLSYDEAKTMIYSELVVQRMTWFKVHSKAYNAVNNRDIKSAYATYCEKNPIKDQWEYEVLSVKAQSEEIAKKIAEKAFELCEEAPSDIAANSDQMKKKLEAEFPTQKFTVSLSDSMKTDTKNISKSHNDVLFKLATNAISAPIRQISKADQSAVYRIFHLKEHTQTALPTLRSMYDKLQAQLVQKAADIEYTKYVGKLRKRYGFDTKLLEETLPSDFQPFMLK